MGETVTFKQKFHLNATSTESFDILAIYSA